jgi:hypothetical protein
MRRGRKPFPCEITVSSGVEGKLLRKHQIEIWEIEEVIYDDPNIFAITYRDCHFIYGQTFAGRYLLILVRVLRKEEVEHLGIETDLNVIRVITARDMDHKQRREYLKRRGN